MGLRGYIALSLTLTASALQLHLPATSRRSSTVTMKAIPDKFQWVNFANAADCKPGTITSGFQRGLEVAIVCDKKGGISAFTNKIPPFGQPATFAELGDGTIIDPVTKSEFSLRTGKPVGTWCPAPPFIGSVIFARITEPAPLTRFECRKSGNAIQVKVNVNAKAQFEEGYWRGILDAQGKTDGGYY